MSRHRGKKDEIFENELLEIYASLRRAFGHRNWWPAEEPFEVIIGAILTQNVSWNNASKAISNLKREGKLSPSTLYECSVEDIAPLIKPARFYNSKAVKIKNFMEFFFKEYGGDLAAMSSEDSASLRKKLLAVKGLGKETVDCILLYACGKPVFVVDAYTKRIFLRYGILNGDPTYDEIQGYFMASLPPNAALYNDYHAQIVHLGSSICRPKPLCGSCPIATNGKLNCHYLNAELKTKKVI
ncbi:DNA-3-methyladenine glycosylase III [Methanocella conradii HZ254]|uniref:DNA-3-methyladenine glycosylase III n=1 Tax=Methanocella conradii (strain DSM 24694 / JCM 17849 / CGMCC 1.5162 / HZ254) TaxID=1041930 RepID=H8I612_METCZ|nr:(Fe-S)-cluster assembly protein [Methanocella conradii]AFD00246.1 DNA-3-methyladenine glycosylase III [Methanocella conradii HZ254]MDI6895943.1 endonuclease III domain-containing protein [Methanocella conradii]